MSVLSRPKLLAFVLITVVVCTFLSLRCVLFSGGELELAERLHGENVEIGLSSDPQSCAFGLFSTEVTYVTRVELLSDMKVAPTWEVSQGGLDAIQNCRRMSSLVMRGATSIDTRFIQNCRSLPHFSTLDLSGTRIDDSIFPYLAKSERLQNLRLLDCDISDEGLSHLADLRTLRVLSVRNKEVTGRFLHSFSENNSLYAVVLYGNRINASHLAALSNTPVEVIAITCKPSDLPKKGLLESNIKRIEVSYDFDLDEKDREMIEALASRETGRHVLMISPNREEPEWGPTAARGGSR